MSTHSFYSKLPSFDKFSEFIVDRHFHALPPDWSVVVSDIEGSTTAIEAGRYKDVNLVGAATIAAAKNALQGQDFPFVFGGDGATFAFHKSLSTEIIRAMAGLQTIASRNFNLVLRVGLVGVQELHEAGAQIEIGKYELIAGRHLALFRGGGLTLAEKWIKQSGSSYCIASPENSCAILDGLSCRWNSIPNVNGVVLSLLIQARGDSPKSTYSSILEELNNICDDSIEVTNPVNLPTLTYQSIRKCLLLENRLHLPKWSRKHVHRILEIIACVLVFRFKIPPLFFNPKSYTRSMRTHADYRKFDDLLRMVIDVSHEQRDAIVSYLEELYNQGSVFYGIHQSNDSLMTCLVDDICDGQHVHFIDGAEGGYAKAAKQLKAQLKKAAHASLIKSKAKRKRRINQGAHTVKKSS